MRHFSTPPHRRGAGLLAALILLGVLCFAGCPTPDGPQGAGLVTVEFSLGQDEYIDLSADKNSSLFQRRNDKLVVSVAGIYDSYAWYVDGGPRQGQGKRFSLMAASHFAGLHRVAVIVSKDGVPYSKELRFKVVQ
jgi:hypothetical protein